MVKKEYSVELTNLLYKLKNRPAVRKHTEQFKLLQEDERKIYMAALKKKSTSERKKLMKRMNKDTTKKLMKRINKDTT